MHPKGTGGGGCEYCIQTLSAYKHFQRGIPSERKTEIGIKQTKCVRHGSNTIIGSSFITPPFWLLFGAIKNRKRELWSQPFAACCPTKRHRPLQVIKRFEPDRSSDFATALLLAPKRAPLDTRVAIHPSAGWARPENPYNASFVQVLGHFYSSTGSKRR